MMHYKVPNYITNNSPSILNIVTKVPFADDLPGLHCASANVIKLITVHLWWIKDKPKNTFKKTLSSYVFSVIFDKSAHQRTFCS